MTVNKVAPELSAAIGTSCPPGESVEGIDGAGNLVCAQLGGSAGPDYFPYGPQVDVHPSRLNEWTQCYMDLYNNVGTPVADIINLCNKSKLLLACRPVGNTRFTLLAAGDRADVLTDTGQDFTTTTLGNGTEWYFNDSRSWGFAGEGDVVNKSSCDFAPVDGIDQRLCFHTLGGNIGGGYRCGTTINLNNDPTWERHIYHAD